MNPRRNHLSISTLALLLVCGGVHGEELLHNPFKRPQISPATKVTGVKHKTTSTAKKRRAPSFRLTTTMVAGMDSMANINGKLLAIGDSLSGYRLTEVEEHAVLMVKQNHKVIVKLQP